MPLCSAPNIEECMRTSQPVKNGEEVCFNGMLMLKASLWPGAWQLYLHQNLSLRHSMVVHLLRRWHADKRNLLVLEQGVDAELTLKPFMPVAIKVLECSFLSGIKVWKVNPLLEVVQLKLVLFPEDLKSQCPLKEDTPWSYLYYTKGKTIEIPNIWEDYKVRRATDVACRLQPRQLDETIAVARLRAKLYLSNGQYVLVAPKGKSDQNEAAVTSLGSCRCRPCVAGEGDRMWTLFLAGCECERLILYPVGEKLW